MAECIFHFASFMQRMSRVVLWARGCFIFFWIIDETRLKSNSHLQSFIPSHLISLVHIEVQILSQVVIIKRPGSEKLSGLFSKFAVWQLNNLTEKSWYILFYNRIYQLLNIQVRTWQFYLEEYKQNCANLLMNYVLDRSLLTQHLAYCLLVAVPNENLGLLALSDKTIFPIEEYI